MVARLFETVRHRARRLRDAEAHSEGECAFLRTRHCEPRKCAERAGLNCGVQYFEVALPAPGITARGAARVEPSETLGRRSTRSGGGVRSRDSDAAAQGRPDRR